MNDRSLSRHAITFFALRAILTQAATLAIDEVMAIHKLKV
jgi:hypothetical protein